MRAFHCDCYNFNNRNGDKSKNEIKNGWRNNETVNGYKVNGNRRNNVTEIIDTFIYFTLIWT